MTEKKRFMDAEVRMRGGRLHLPKEFGETLSDLLKVKPPPKPGAIETVKPAIRKQARPRKKRR